MTTSNLADNHFFVTVAPEIKIFVSERSRTDVDKSNAVILLHSAGIDQRMWDCSIKDYSMMNYLAEQGMRVFAMDYRGFGRSSRLENGNSITIATAAADVATVIRHIQEQEGLGKMKVYGTSVGAIVGAKLASDYPDLVDRLAMTGGFYYSMKGVAQQMFPEQFFLDSKSGYINYSPAAMAEFMPSAEPDVVEWYQNSYPATEDFPGGLFINFWHLPAVNTPNTITAPVLLVNGENDVFTTRADALRFIGEIGSKDVTYIEHAGVGHAPMVEEGYREFRTTLSDFLNK